MQKEKKQENRSKKVNKGSLKSTTGSPLQGKEPVKSPLQNKAMPTPILKNMNEAFDYDFSGVNIVENSPVAKQKNVTAMADQNEVHFFGNIMNTDTKFGMQLIGHELAHIVQQNNPKTNGLSASVSTLESEANFAGKNVAAGGKAQINNHASKGTPMFFNDFMPLNAAVGANGVNDPVDVSNVQRALRQTGLQINPYKDLEGAIKVFQKSVGISNPDGNITPKKITHEKLSPYYFQSFTYSWDASTKNIDENQSAKTQSTDLYGANITIPNLNNTPNQEYIKQFKQEAEQKRIAIETSRTKDLKEQSQASNYNQYSLFRKIDTHNLLIIEEIMGYAQSGLIDNDLLANFLNVVSIFHKDLEKTSFITSESINLASESLSSMLLKLTAEDLTINKRDLQLGNDNLRNPLEIEYFKATGSSVRTLLNATEELESSPGLNKYHNFIGAFQTYAINAIRLIGGDTTSLDAQAGMRGWLLELSHDQIAHLRQLPAVFYADDSNESIRPHIYYTHDKKNWYIYNLSKNPSAPFRWYIPYDGKSHPPKSLFQALNDKDSLPKGSLYYDLGYGEQKIECTESWEAEDWLKLASVSVAITAATIGTGGGALPFISAGLGIAAGSVGIYKAHVENHLDFTTFLSNATDVIGGTLAFSKLLPFASRLVLLKRGEGLGKLGKPYILKMEIGNNVVDVYLTTTQDVTSLMEQIESGDKNGAIWTLTYLIAKNFVAVDGIKSAKSDLDVNAKTIKKRGTLQAY